MSKDASKITRRQFIKLTAGASAGLTLGVALGGCDGGAADTAFKPNLWVQIQVDDVIKIFLAEAEMGQGVATALPMLVAEELEVRLEALTVERAPLTPEYGNQSTGGSSSVRGAWMPLRQAGATNVKAGGTLPAHASCL